MQWNNKYSYPTSTRSIVGGSRHYSVNEERLPSVTTILKATESEEKKAKLAEWKNRVGHKQAEIISREATSRGSSMHDYLEKFLLGKLNLDLLTRFSLKKWRTIFCYSRMSVLCLTHV